MRLAQRRNPERQRWALALLVAVLVGATGLSVRFGALNPAQAENGPWAAQRHGPPGSTWTAQLPEGPPVLIQDAPVPLDGPDRSRIDPRFVVPRDPSIDPGILVEKDPSIDPGIFAGGMPGDNPPALASRLPGMAPLVVPWTAPRPVIPMPPGMPRYAPAPPPFPIIPAPVPPGRRPDRED